MPDERGKARKPTSGESLAGAFNLLGTARGQILSELCGQRLTAQELARRFSISSNAIRMHLSGLREAGLVRYESASRGVGKPTHVYELTPAGQYFVSRAYLPALTHVIGAVSARVPTLLGDILRDAGRALASAQSDGSEEKNLQRSVKRCVSMLRSLGGRATAVETSAAFTIRSECCPLAALVTEQPSACKLLEGLTREITGREAREQCDRGHRPHCQFVVTK